MPAISYDRFRREILEIYELRRPATYRKIRQVLDEFGLLAKSTADLKPVTIARWLKAHPDRSRATAMSLLGSFSAACNLGVASGYLKASPCLSRKVWFLDAGPTRSRPGRHHSAGEIARVLNLLDAEAGPGDWCSGRLRALVYTVAFTGLRKLEALGLEAVDVDLPERMVRLRPNRWRPLKTAKSAQPVPIAEALAAVLAGWIPRCGSPLVFPTRRGTEPWFHGGPGYKPLDLVKAAGERAGVDGLTFLSLRHSWATHAETLWHLSGPTIQRVLRHTSERTSLDHYRHADEPNLRNAVAAIGFGCGIRGAG